MHALVHILTNSSLNEDGCKCMFGLQYWQPHSPGNPTDKVLKRSQLALNLFILILFYIHYGKLRQTLSTQSNASSRLYQLKRIMNARESRDTICLLSYSYNIGMFFACKEKKWPGSYTTLLV